MAIAISLYFSAGAPSAPGWLRDLMAETPKSWVVGPGFLSWLFGLVAIFLGALAFCKPGAETAVASELIVVYGIFCLLSNMKRNE